MNPYVLLGALLATASAAFYGGVQYEQAASTTAQRDVAVAYAGRIKEVVEQHDNDQTIIDTQHAQLVRMQHARLPKCPSSADQDGEAGILYGAADAAFEDLQSGDDEDFARCDQLNIDARRTNSALK